MWDAFTVPVEGATLSGERRGGSGSHAPLVLIHGMGSSRAGWDPVIAALPAGLPLIRYDLRGFGASPWDQSLTYSHTDDLRALLDAQGIERAALCGLSMGGAIAANFALSHPDRVTQAVLVSPALVGWEWSDEWRAHWRAASRAARSGDLATAREAWWQHPMFTAAREDEVAAHLLREEIAEFGGAQWIGDPQAKALPDVERLHQLAAPTLLLTGARDFPDFRLIADLLEAIAPDLRRIDYAGAGHMLPLERPAEVARALGQFLQP